MYINRAKALLLVGTISAGCASNDDATPDNPAVGGSAGTGGAASAGQGGGGSGGTPAGGSAGQGGGAGSGGSAGQGGGGAGGTPSGGAGTGGTSSNGGSGPGAPDAGSPDAGLTDAGTSDAGSSDAGDAGACYDSADTLVTCSGLGENDCSGQEGFLSFECEMIEFNMKPATSNAARNCMIALNPPELCDAANTYACINAALAGSCPDAEADDECATIGATCGDSAPELDACSATLSGMTQDGRDQMVTCMTTESCDLYACVEGLSF